MRAIKSVHTGNTARLVTLAFQSGVCGHRRTLLWLLSIWTTIFLYCCCCCFSSIFQSAVIIDNACEISQYLIYSTTSLVSLSYLFINNFFFLFVVALVSSVRYQLHHRAVSETCCFLPDGGDTRRPVNDCERIRYNVNLYLLYIRADLFMWETGICERWLHELSPRTARLNESFPLLLLNEIVLRNLCSRTTTIIYCIVLLFMVVFICLRCRTSTRAKLSNMQTGWVLLSLSSASQRCVLYINRKYPL